MTMQDNERVWLEKMIALEDELGPIVPNGAVGGAVARARAAAARVEPIETPAPVSPVPAITKHRPNAAERARSRVRFVTTSTETVQDEAA